jgi:hypothetical protein
MSNAMILDLWFMIVDSIITPPKRGFCNCNANIYPFTIEDEGKLGLFEIFSVIPQSAKIR